MWSGRTRQNKLVHFAPDGTVAVGGTADILVTRAAPHWLRGDLLRAEAPRTTRVRIPIPVTAAPA
jgi:hypothetical protein